MLFKKKKKDLVGLKGSRKIYLWPTFSNIFNYFAFDIYWH